MKNFTTRLQQLLLEVPEKLQAYSPEEMTPRPAPGKWSKREILGHLCDSALYNWQRFTAAQLQHGPLRITPYPQAELVQLNQYQHLPTGHLIALWASLNAQIVATVRAIPAEKLAHPVELPAGAPQYSVENSGTLRWCIEDYLVHLEHHLQQIFGAQNLAATAPSPHWHLHPDEALAALAAHPEGQPFLTLLEHRKMYVEVYAPAKIDRQQPHSQDEIYVVISGTGTFFNGGESRSFRPGDLLFVPAGVEHRFLDFSDDFSTWVIFF